MTPAQAVRALHVRLQPALNEAAMAIAARLHGVIAPYPPSSEANQARGWTRGGRNSWYERGFGAKWVTKNGGVHGKQTSQTLGRSWQIRATGTGAVVGTGASYAPFVQHDGQQAAFHAKRGWITDKQAVEQVMASGAIPKIVAEALAAAFKHNV